MILKKKPFGVQMFISIKYVIFYTCVGGVVGYFADGDKKVAIAGAILSALMGSTFGVEYAILSAIEFGIGFFIGSTFKKKEDVVDVEK
jgi:uncharacterized membrane protein (UPF0136 family)